MSTVSDKFVPILNLERFIKNMNQESLLKLKNSFTNHPGFKHPFWDWFENGRFSDDQLRAFARLYYQHVRIFRQYIAGGILVSKEELTQKILTEILSDEYGIPDVDINGNERISHPEMYRRFLKSIGLSYTNFENEDPILGISYFKSVHFSLFTAGLEEESLGAIIFGCEGSTPYRHARVIAGLSKYEKNTSKTIDKTFFSSHIDIDQHHFSKLVDVVGNILRDPTRLDRFINGINISFDARKVFLDDLCIKIGLNDILQ